MAENGRCRLKKDVCADGGKARTLVVEGAGVFEKNGDVVIEIRLRIAARWEPNKTTRSTRSPSVPTAA